MEQTNKILTNIPKRDITQSGYVLPIQIDEKRYSYVSIIDTDISSPKTYADLITTLFTANPGDEILIKIYTFGGWVEAGINICNAIFNSKANVTTEAIGVVASIGAVIWSCGKTRIIRPGASLMYHMPSAMMPGKTLDTKEDATNICNYFEALIRMITVGILDDADITDLVQKRKDIYLPAQKVTARIKHYQEGIKGAA